MASQRRRRVRPLKRSDTPSTYKKRKVSVPVEIQWKGAFLKILTTLIIVFDIVLVVFIVRHCTGEVPEASQPSVPPPRVIEENRVLRIEVLNGCNVNRLAARYTDYLRARGFDVVKTDNYESMNVEHTVVIDRIGDKKNVMRIAEALGLNDILSGVNEAYLLDATVIIGKDFRSLSSWREMELQP